MALDQDLKVIIDYLIKDGKDAGKKGISLVVPDDYKEVLYSNLSDVKAYISQLGYTCQDNAPDDNSWRGWDVPLAREGEFPEGYALGRNHNNYQLMEASANNLMIKVVF